jgi:D-psicose/D-tagatose/L-ribulose 3-epimerase
MLLGFNLLLWTTHVTEEHFPILAEIKQAGYDGVELPVFEGTPEHYRRIGQVLKDNGLRATAVTVMPDAARDCASSDPAVRQAALGHITWAVDCLHAAGGEVLCGPMHQPLGVFSGVPPTAAERANIVAVHQQAVAHAAGTSIKLSIEPLNRFECYVLNTVADSADLVRAVGAPGFGYLYDSFHSNIEETDPVGAVAAAIAELNHVHLSENHRGTPGSGHVPWEPLLRTLKHSGYEGWYVVEAFGRALPALAAATRVWRDFFSSPQVALRSGHDFLRDTWAKV